MVNGRVNFFRLKFEINRIPVKNSSDTRSLAKIGAVYQFAIPISTNENSKVSITGYNFE